MSSTARRRRSSALWDWAGPLAHDAEPGPLLPSCPGDERRSPLASERPWPPGLRLASASGPQRWNPVGGFCEALLPSDRWPWSDVSGLQHRPLDGVALPSPHWEWESDWYVDENFGGEPTEKGVGALGSRRGPPAGGSTLGSARPPSALPSAPWHQTSAWAPRAPCLPDGIHGEDAASGRAPPPSCSPFPSSFTSFLQSLTDPPPISVLQGWTYAIDFPHTYTRDKKWNSCVRRRRWTRYRRYKSRDTWAKVRGPACGRGQEAGPRAQSCSGEGHAALSPTLPALLRGCHARPGAWPFLLSCSEGCGPGRPFVWEMAARGAGPDRGPGQHRIVLTWSPGCPVPDSGSVCARLPPLPPTPRGSRSGSCIFPVTHKNQLRDARPGLGS